MPQSLVAVHAFAGHVPGDTITDAQEIARILACELKDHVVRVAPQLQQQAAVSSAKEG